MATSIRSPNSNSFTTGTNVFVGAPAGTAAGDAVVISVHCNNNTTIVDNNAATPFTTDLSAYSPNPVNGQTVAIFSRRIQAGDPGTYNFTIGTSGRWSIVAVTFQTPDPSNLYDVAPSTSNAANADDSTAATINAPSITTSTNNSIQVACGYLDDGTGGIGSFPVGYTTQASPINQPQTISTKTITPAGATGAQTYTGSMSAPRIALSFAVKYYVPPVSTITGIQSVAGIQSITF